MRIEFHGLPVVGERVFIALRGIDIASLDLENEIKWSRVRLSQQGIVEERIANSGLTLNLEDNMAGWMIRVALKAPYKSDPFIALSWPIMSLDTSRRFKLTQSPYLLKNVVALQRVLSAWASLQEERQRLESSKAFIDNLNSAQIALDRAEELFAISQKIYADAQELVGLPEQEKELRATLASLEEKIRRTEAKLSETIQESQRQSARLANLAKQRDQEVQFARSEVARASAEALRIKSQARAEADALLADASERAAMLTYDLELELKTIRETKNLDLKLRQVEADRRALRETQEYLERQIRELLEARRIKVKVDAEFVSKFMAALPEAVADTKREIRRRDRERYANPVTANICPSCFGPESACAC